MNVCEVEVIDECVVCDFGGYEEKCYVIWLEFSFGG